MTKMTQMYLIRGLPGAGKTTLAKKLVGSHRVLEADQFMHENGEYKFDHAALASAHLMCQDNARVYIESALGPFAVANTFTTGWELAPYLRMAKSYGMRREDIIILTAYGNFVSIHSVPERTMCAMRARFEHNSEEIFKKYWNNNDNLG